MNRVLVASCAVVVVVAAAFVAAASSWADDAAKPAAPAAPAMSAKEEKVRKLIRLAGGEATAHQMIDRMMEQFRKLPQLPAGFVDKFKEKADVQHVTDLAVPAYVKHLDDATLDGAIAFYESPAGKEMVAQQPAMMAESMEAGAAWGRKIAQDIMKELKEESGK